MALIDIALEQEYLIPYGAACMGAQIVLYVLYRYLLPSGPWKQLPSFTAHQTVALFLMVQWSVIGIQSFNETGVFTVNEGGLFVAQCATGGLLIWDIPVGFFSDGMNDPIMHAHHIGMFTVSAIVLGFFTGGVPIGSSYAPFFFGVVEISSIPLQIVDLFHPKQKAWHEYHLKSPMLVQLNELCRTSFALAFLAVRGVYFPYIVFRHVVPDFLQGIQDKPAYALPMYTIVVLSVFFTLLQLYWALLIVKQIAKALGGGGGGKDDEKKIE